MNDIIDAYVPATSPPDTSELHEDTFAHDSYSGTSSGTSSGTTTVLSAKAVHVDDG